MMISIATITMLDACRALGLAMAAVLGYYFYVGYRVRARFQRLQKQDLPMIPHHPVFGHLPVIGKLLSELPPDAHGDYMPHLVVQRWRALYPSTVSRLPPVVYLDMWPFAPPMAISVDGDVSAQFTQDLSLPKPLEQGRFMRRLTENRDAASTHGEEWARRRRALNPVFAAQNITARVPELLEEVDVFVGLLRERAGRNGGWGRVFEMQRMLELLTLDLINHFSLDVRMHDQTTTPISAVSHGILDTLKRQYMYRHIGNVFHELNPRRLYQLRCNQRGMNAALAPLIRAQFARAREALGRGSRDTAARRGLDLTGAWVKAAMAEAGGEEKGEKGEKWSSSSCEVDVDDILLDVMGEAKLMVVAGHDTTAFTMGTVINALAQQPAVLAKVRAELDEVLGTGDAGAVLRARPHLLNALTYTSAVIKETMRLYSNVGTLRDGDGLPGFALRGPAGSGYEGVAFPTEGCVVWDASLTIHRREEAWRRPMEFIPERFLATSTTGENDEDDGLLRAPGRNWYRPFAMGQRNCVGQNLATTEVKLVLALTAREFDVECAWDEWDAMRGHGDSDGKKAMVDGDRLYQVGSEGLPKLKDGMPVHVRLRAGRRVEGDEVA